MNVPKIKIIFQISNYYLKKCCNTENDFLNYFYHRCLKEFSSYSSMSFIRKLPRIVQQLVAER